MATPRFVLVLVLALMAVLAPLAGSQAIDSLPQCGQDCVNHMLSSRASSLGCDADNLPCLCPKPDFGFGIRDCAIQACGAAVASTVTSAASALCAIPPTSSASMTGAASSPPAATSSAASTSSSSSSSTTSPSAAPTATTSPTSTQPSSSSPASTVAPISNNGEPSDETSPNVGLSASTKVGLGIGIGLGFVAMLGLALCALMRRRRDHGGLPLGSGSSAASPKRAMSGKSHVQISDPLQGSGRTFANDDQWIDYETQQNELESRSRRYEDMLPRQSPKNMV